MKIFRLICLLTILFGPYSLISQEHLGQKLGGFFEQLYGGSTDEEAIDICSSQQDYLVTGWTDVNTEGVTKDATIWYIDNLGRKNYKIFYGSGEKDEVATGVTDINSEYMAICVHSSSSWIQDSVQPNDFMVVYMLEVATGLMEWRDTLMFEDEGVAPVDIHYDGAEHIYALYNRRDPSGRVSNQIAKYDLGGNLIWISDSYYTQGHGQWASELLLTSSSLVIMPYSYYTKSPEAVEFNTSGVIINQNDFVSEQETRIYGLIEESSSGNIIGAGYTVDDEDDINSYLLEITPSLAFSQSESFGQAGVEKFRDLVETVDGLIAAGVRNNEGEGSYDCYIHHFDNNWQTDLEETFGGINSDRLSSLMIDATETKAFFAGYNTEYGITTSGNAYLGGITTKLGVVQASCDFPRILFIDDLVDDNDQDTPDNLLNYNAIISTCSTHNINTVFLYDVDKIYHPTNPSIQDVKDDLDVFLNALLGAQIKVGFIVGPEIDKVRNLTDIMKGVTQNNTNFAGKINYIMLEHEFWGNNSNYSGFVPLSVLNNSDYGFNWSSNPYPSGTDNKKNHYFWHLTKDHETLLEEINTQLPNNANWWASFDYISYLKNSGFTNATYYDYNSNANGLGTLTTLTGSDPVMQHREGLVEHFLPLVDYTFLVNYRDASNSKHFMTSGGNLVPNFDVSSPNSTLSNSDWLKRLQAYSNKANLSKNSSTFYYINLQSNEETVCSDVGANKLGNWLGGANSYNRAEQAYVDQLQNLSSTCISCGTNSEVVAHAWFDYSCHTSNSSFSNYGLVSGCSTQISIEEQNSSSAGLSVYPNPSNGQLKISGLNNKKEVAFFSLIDVSGRVLLSGPVPADNTVNLPSHLKGLFMLKIEHGSNSTSFRVILN
ncbi:T9SS type A sorting domain-containing protein [Croceimicrobium hydrocarbonivorans]|uniref:T9SS type A sorting domain-containing protein n=1 Tax=Croceimicrobium hydrocarbonivorans TaxID=2761580 RepID=A0A7H0VF39_9FLAO|nr:T9SS type A sorting domain-containing protein [Croceimicrobium hydrocarbonivorans]QNR24337.1 T9SS type A sorting domain-containing protein [Croceimicrobium hydrocarbonivorans]